jgi:hypothetical protein
MTFVNSRYFLLALLVIAVGCEQILGPDPANTPESNFEIFWRDFDLYYAQFKIRNIDWDSVYAVTRPQISRQTTDRQLFGIFSNIVLMLNDMHVSLYTPFGDVYWKGPSSGSYPSKTFVNPCKYLFCGSAQNAVMEFRRCKGDSIGYINIYTFSGNGNSSDPLDHRYLIIDDILQQFKDTKGLLIDVRWNSGGDLMNAENVADRFADQKRPYMTYCEKNGPGDNDFSAWISRSVQPKGAYQYSKPVVVLTSRATSSAAETFVMAMRVLPNVTVVGDTTGGGGGNPVFRELPNGWTYRLSTEIMANADGFIIEGTGIPPDMPVLTTVADSTNGVDRIVEKGIEVIESATSN